MVFRKQTVRQDHESSKLTVRHRTVKRRGAAIAAFPIQELFVGIIESDPERAHRQKARGRGCRIRELGAG